MLHFVTSYMKQNESRKQTLESAQYGLEISFKPRVEATEQTAQNCMDISQSKNQRERKIASKWHV